MRNFLFIMVISLLSSLTGCRANLESKVSQSRQYADEIGVVLRRVDSLSSTISEKHNVKIEFYPPQEYTQGPGKPSSGSPLQTAPSSTMPATDVGHATGHGSVGGGMGAVKSIEITSETEANTHTNTLTDSTAVSKTAEAETLQGEKASEARQDNGTVWIVSVVAGVVLLLALLIIIKKLFHK